ncbi:MAG: hypothetical protein E7105_10080 [Prevotella sp.]|nr:hypothetical protein [Prevotella sp.]
MITPVEIKKKAENKYKAYLQSILEGESFIPIIIVGDKKPNEDTVKFEEELTDLISCSKEKKGYGYTIEYQTVKTKRHGIQDIPTSISFKTEYDYLKYVNKENDTAKFKKDITSILSSFPELKDWIYKYPIKVIENDWESLLKVCNYFKAVPQPHLYIRELPIQVHTKFIENNKGIIRELLEIIIAEHINIDEKQFESRFNLKYDETLVRFRILDKAISQQLFGGIDDISIPISEFQHLSLPIQTVYVVENKINMLTFPVKRNSIVIWGHGFGVDIMKNIDWLKTKRIYYWGDLDAHGFQILSEIRTHFGQVESFLMDRHTFDLFYEGDKGTKTNVAKDLCLTSEESEMFKYLKENNLRLEQEKIPHEYARTKIPQ